MMPIGGEQMPPMDTEGGMGEEMPMDMENTQEMPENGSDMGSDFDTNFDAGVEADEDTDPKKYIQQLTGKLSQTLNTYNNENGEPDTELGKYVLGMLVKQGTKGMDEKDKKEIIKKINMNNSDDDESDLSDDTEMPEEDLEQNVSDEMQMESKTIRCTKKQIFESFGVVMNDTEKLEKEPDTTITKDVVKNRRTRPFEAPKKFRD
jgi:hypothetical protein